MAQFIESGPATPREPLARPISVSPAEAARHTQIPEHTIRRAMADGSLPHLEINHKVKVIYLEKLYAWLDQFQAGPAHPAAAKSARTAAPVMTSSLRQKLRGRRRR